MSDIDTCQTSDTLFLETLKRYGYRKYLCLEMLILHDFSEIKIITFYKFCDAESGMDSGGACDNALWIYVIRFLSL